MFSSYTCLLSKAGETIPNFVLYELFISYCMPQWYTYISWNIIYAATECVVVSAQLLSLSWQYI